MKGFSCFIIGDGLLAIACSEHLLQQGHDILGIVTSCQEIMDWCKEHNIVCMQEDQMMELKNYQFDYLLSITYLKLIPEEIIKLPNKLAINYHDAMLPRYAGINATSWAIIQGESSHGITWHVMEEKVDTGDILIQKEIGITDEETSFSLNMKCFQEGLQGFKDLVVNLQKEQITRIPQDFGKRTYYKKKKKPEGAGIIDFRQSVQVIKRLYQGLQFGKYDNTLATPKIMVNGDIYLVADLKVILERAQSKLETGESGIKETGIQEIGIGEIKEGVLSVCAKDGIVQIAKLKDLWGNYISIKELAERYGSRIELHVTEAMREQLSQELQTVSKYEEYWVKKLEAVLDQQLKNSKTEKPKYCDKLCADDVQEAGYFSRIVFMIQEAVGRVLGVTDVSLGFIQRQTNSWVQQSKLCGEYVPFELHWNPKSTYKERLEGVTEEREQVETRITFSKDIFARYSKLRGKQFIPFAVLDCSVDNQESAQAALVVKCHESNKKCECIYNQKLDQSGKVREILNEMRDWSEKNLESVIQITEREETKFYSTYELFMRQVATSKNAIAVVYKNEQLTYECLSKQIDTLAAVLRKNGVRKGTNVGVMLKRSPKIIVSFLAVMKLGGVYIPMDPIYPEERLEYMAEDAQIEYLICEKHEESVCIKGNFQEIVVDKIDEKVQFDESPVAEINPRDPVYILYTSGSTGKPKGVIVNHGGLSNFLLSMKKVPGFTAQDKLLALTTVCFDISGLELYLPLICGGTTEILQDGVVIDGRMLKEKIESSKATIVQATPSTWNMIIISGWNSKLNLKILCGGEKLTNHLAEKLLGLCDELWNMYGPTETTIWSLVKRITAGENVTIGKAIDYTQLYILDDELEPANEDPGELYIGGQGVATGYYNKADITKEKFVVNPYQMTEVIYRTGDLVQQLDNGDMQYLGRVDNQIKYHGYRIELEEIEHIMQEKLKLEKVVAVLRKNEREEAYLCAFVKDIRAGKKMVNYQSLSEFLPHYMIPAQIYMVKDYPLTENKKVNRRFLQSNAIEEILHEFGCGNQVSISKQADPEQEEQNYVGSERMIKELWERILQHEVLSKDIPFFEAGGNSLLLNHVRSELETAFSKNIDIVDLLSYNTISKMSSLMDNHDKKETEKRATNKNMAMKRKMFLERARR